MHARMCISKRNRASHATTEKEEEEIEPKYGKNRAEKVVQATAKKKEKREHKPGNNAKKTACHNWRHGHRERKNQKNYY